MTPILNMARLVTEDHELHGQQLHAGDQLVLMYSSANHDEEVFDDPDTYDVGRAHNNHIAFGFGTHFCLGSSLARLEIKLFFEEFLRRVQSFEITPGTTPDRVPGRVRPGYRKPVPGRQVTAPELVSRLHLSLDVR